MSKVRPFLYTVVEPDGSSQVVEIIPCGDCGALVWNPLIHNNFHSRNH